jgi:hypothetical protein
MSVENFLDFHCVPHFGINAMPRQVVATPRGNPEMEHGSENQDSLNQERLKNIVADFGGVLEWKKYNRESTKDDLEYELKGTAYLMAGNAAGLVGSLTFMKDYDPSKVPIQHAIRHIGYVVGIFSAGFVLASFALFMFFVVRYTMGATLEFREPLPISATNSMRVLQGSSLLALVVAVVVIAAKVINN